MKHNPGFLKLCEEARARIRELSIEEVSRRLGSGPPFVLLDVREDREWQAGHISGAVHLGRGVLERDVETRIPDLATPIVAYCGGGYRSALAAEVLQRMGYTEVASMAGGWRRWLELGGAVEPQ